MKTVNLKDYFNKIKLDLTEIQELIKVDKVEALKRIYYAHITTIPYNNFEIRKAAHQHPIQRVALTFFNHSQVMSQGGYCFQSNAMLDSVLTQLGFASSFCQARALLGCAVNAKEILRLPATHVILVVSIGEQKFFLEPSMGMQAPRFPILIHNSKEPIIQHRDEFRFYQEDGVFVLEKKMKGTWFTLLQTDLIERSEKELALNLWKLGCSAQSLAIRDKKTLVALVTEKGGKALFWDVDSNKLKFMKEEDGVFSQQILSDFDIAHALLISEFNINTVSLDELKLYCSALDLPRPKRPWEIDFPITAKDLECMEENLTYRSR